MVRIGVKAGAGGVRHLSKGWLRMLLFRRRDYYLARFQDQGLKSMPALRDGQQVICPMCGFAKVNIKLPSGWSMEMCSAQPCFPHPDVDALAARLPHSLESPELPMPGGNSYTVTGEEKLQADSGPDGHVSAKQPQQKTHR